MIEIRKSHYEADLEKVENYVATSAGNSGVRDKEGERAPTDCGCADERLTVVSVPHGSQSEWLWLP